MLSLLRILLNRIFIVLPFDQTVIAYNLGYTNIKIYKLGNEWHGFSLLHLFAVAYIYISLEQNTTLKLNLVSYNL